MSVIMESTKQCAEAKPENLKERIGSRPIVCYPNDNLENENYEDIGDPEILSRMSQYEMAYRMQTSVPEVMDVSNEPDYIFDMYGEESKNPGTFAANCLLARKLVEKESKM